MKSLGNDVLLDAWRETFSRLRDEAAIFDTARNVRRTFAEIEEETEIARRELLADLRPQDVVAIQIGNHESWPALLLACLREQLVVLPLESTIAPNARDAALAVCGVRAVVSAMEDKLTVAAQQPQRAPDWNGEPPCLLKLTSGTTAAPRAVRFRSEQLLADCGQICETMEITDRDLNFAVVPVSHSYGFSNVLTPLLARGVPFALSRDRMPRAILDGIIATEATVFPGMPVFYQAICEIQEPPPMPTLRLCISAGAPLPLELARTFRSKFGRPIHSFYGSSECGGICFDRSAPLLEDGFVGTPMERVTVEPLDPESESSRVRVRTAAAGDGYFPEADAEQLGGGMFLPDDLLARTDDGFRIVGRVSDLINVAGKKVNPTEVESELLRFPGVRAAVAYGRRSAMRNEEVAACVVADADVTEPTLVAHCRARLSGWQVPKRITFVEQIPVNHLGKISRRDLAERFG